VTLVSQALRAGSSDTTLLIAGVRERIVHELITTGTARRRGSDHTNRASVFVGKRPKVRAASSSSFSSSRLTQWPVTSLDPLDDYEHFVEQAYKEKVRHRYEWTPCTEGQAGGEGRKVNGAGEGGTRHARPTTLGIGVRHGDASRRAASRHHREARHSPHRPRHREEPDAKYPRAAS